MKYLLLIALLCVGCAPEGSRRVDSTDGEVRIVIVEDCEYLRTTVYAGWVYTHKGNCKNPIHLKSN